MAGLAFQLPGGRFRRAEFFVCIPPGINRQLLLDGVRTFKQEVREFCILGNMNMLPTGFFPENHNQHLAIPTDVFYFKKLPHAANQLRVIPRDLAFLRVVGVQNMPIIGLPLSGKNDFRIRQLEFLCANDYYGFDHGGNEFSLAAWLARAKMKCTAEVITKILDGQITTYKEKCFQWYGKKVEKVSKTFKVWVKISFVIADEQTCMRKHPQRHKRNRKKFLSIKHDFYSPKQDANILKTANLAMILVTSDQLIEK